MAPPLLCPTGSLSAGLASPRDSLGCRRPEVRTDLLGLPEQVTAVQPHTYGPVAQLTQGQGYCKEVGKTTPAGRDKGMGGAAAALLSPPPPGAAWASPPHTVGVQQALEGLGKGQSIGHKGCPLTRVRLLHPQPQVGTHTFQPRLHTGDQVHPGAPTSSWSQHLGRGVGEGWGTQSAGWGLLPPGLKI